ncbi:MAG: TetR/AcrR family transcriptional regulator [Candidatus Methanoplasma sp.]|jgi:AcrR family transcriptional regulator|nr:TetR/AcrR family transcriptional regulator [Candidatus Methanoplasma sp.]
MNKVSGKRQLQKTATREHILNTALAVYAEHGFSASTNVIAQEARLAHGTVFVHFPTREDMLQRTLERFASELGDKLHELSETEDDLKNFLYTHIDILTKYEHLYKNIITELSSLPPAATTSLIAVQSIASHHFGNVIANCAGRYAVKPIPLHMLFNIWMALLHYYLLNSELFAPGRSVLNSRRDELVNSYMELIRN